MRDLLLTISDEDIHATFGIGGNVLGLPVMLIELAGVPRREWGLVMLIEIPANIVGVFAFALIEHGVVHFIQRHWTGDQLSPK